MSANIQTSSVDSILASIKLISNETAIKELISVILSMALVDPGQLNINPCL